MYPMSQKDYTHTHTQAHALTQRCSCEFKAPPRAADGGSGGKPENERMDE